MFLMQENPVILFDGVCNLCNGAVNFVIRHDKKRKFRFAPLQSNAGMNLREQFSLPTSINTILLISNGQVYDRSRAALEIARQLTFPFPLLYGFIIVPAFIRNTVYRFISRNRYKWFGKKDACMVPGPGISERFLL